MARSGSGLGPLALGDGDEQIGRTELNEKSRWRSKAKADRAGIAVDHARFCQVLADFLDRHVAEGARVVLYRAMGDEVLLDALADRQERPEDRFAVTRTPDRDLVLTIHPWGGPEERHAYGYLQPRAGAPTVADEEVGAVLVPGLAFDRLGTRLGRGKGYYDRLLARMPPHCLFIGITGDYLVERLPAEEFDVAMTHLAFSDGVRAVPLGDP